jgi:hypothetical protein
VGEARQWERRDRGRGETVGERPAHHTRVKGNSAVAGLACMLAGLRGVPRVLRSELDRNAG